MFRPALIAAACAALSLTACGSSTHTAVTATTPAKKQCVSPKAIAKLNADIAAIRRARGNTGATNRTTDRFLLDVATAPVPNLTRNRMIDHAVGALGGECEQCFQALEAARPIPNIRTGARC